MRIKNSIFIIILLLLTLTSTGNFSEKTIAASTDKNGKEGELPMFGMKETEYLETQFGIAYDYVKDIDLVSLFEDYQIFSRDYSREEIIDIIDTDRDYYVHSDLTELMYTFNAEDGDVFLEDRAIKKVAFRCNVGTENSVFVFDFESGQCLDNDTIVPITDSMKEKVCNLISDCNISNWASHYEGEEEPSTGSLGWKLVIVFDDDSCCVYDGYTQDGTHLPKEYFDFSNGLRKMMYDEQTQ